MRFPALKFVLMSCFVSSCGGVDRTFSGGPPKGPIAVGSSAIGGVGSTTCRHGERGSWCDSNTVEILSLSAEPAGIFAIEKNEMPNGSYMARALTEGTAKISITASDGFETRTFTGDLSAHSVNDVRVAPVNRRGKACSEPLLYGIGTWVQLPFELYHDSTELLGSGLYPFELAGVELLGDQLDARQLSLKMPATAGTGMLTSKADPSFALPIQIFAATEVQAIRIGDPAAPISAKAYNGTSISVDLEVGGRAACQTPYTSTYAVSTQDTCTLSDNSTLRAPSITLPGLQNIQIYGLKAGLCTLTVTLEGTSVSASKGFPISS